MDNARQIATKLLASLYDLLERDRTPTATAAYLFEYENTVTILSMRTGEDLNRFRIPKEAIKQEALVLQDFGPGMRICYDPTEPYCAKDYFLAKIASLSAHIHENELPLVTELPQ